MAKQLNSAPSSPVRVLKLEEKRQSTPNPKRAPGALSVLHRDESKESGEAQGWHDQDFDSGFGKRRGGEIEEFLTKRGFWKEWVEDNAQFGVGTPAGGGAESPRVPRLESDEDSRSISEAASEYNIESEPSSDELASPASVGSSARVSPASAAADESAPRVFVDSDENFDAQWIRAMQWLVPKFLEDNAAQNSPVSAVAPVLAEEIFSESDEEFSPEALRLQRASGASAPAPWDEDDLCAYFDSARLEEESTTPVVGLSGLINHGAAASDKE